MLSLFASLALSFSANAKELPSLTPSLDLFMEICREHHYAPAIASFKAPRAGQTVFVPTPALVANQGRFSWSETQKKLEKTVVDKARAYIDKKTGEWVRNYDQGRSAFPEDKAIRGIYHKGKVFIVDGHHRALISTYIGSQTIPVHIIAVLSARRSLAEVRDYMAANEWAHFVNYRGQPTRILDLCEMVDDPNLGLARQLIARVGLELKNGKLHFTNVRGPELVIGVKVENDLPFLEFEIADTLRRAGVTWDDSNAPPSRELLATYLDILENAVERNPESRLSQVLLFERPSRVADLDLQPALTAHLHELGCEDLLEGVP